VGHAGVVLDSVGPDKKIYGTIKAWRNRPIEGDHPYVFLDGIVLKRNWAGEVRNVSLLVAMGVNERGHREIFGICEGAKGNKEGWSAFLKHLKERGLKGACIGLAESAAEFFLKAAWQSCVVHTCLDQGAGDRGHAQGTPRQQGPRGSTQEGQPSEAAGRRRGCAPARCSRPTRRYGCSPGTITSGLHRAVLLFKSRRCRARSNIFLELNNTVATVFA
jgi:hypothetical protein